MASSSRPKCSRVCWKRTSKQATTSGAGAAGAVLGDRLVELVEEAGVLAVVVVDEVEGDLGDGVEGDEWHGPNLVRGPSGRTPAGHGPPAPPGSDRWPVAAGAAASGLRLEARLRGARQREARGPGSPPMTRQRPPNQRPHQPAPAPSRPEVVKATPWDQGAWRLVQVTTPETRSGGLRRARARTRTAGPVPRSQGARGRSAAAARAQVLGAGRQLPAPVSAWTGTSIGRRPPRRRSLERLVLIVVHAGDDAHGGAVGGIPDEGGHTVRPEACR